MKEALLNQTFITHFIHTAGLIIALGAVTVIDSLGFTSRNSKELTQVTIHAHHITKPLIWLGTIPFAISWLYIYDGSQLAMMKSFLLGILVLNGCFLSFHISPRLDRLIGKNVVLPQSMQIKITISMLISFFSWWSIVAITVFMST